MTIALINNKTELDSFCASNKLIVLEMYADFCPACVALKTYLDECSSVYKDVQFAYIDGPNYEVPFKYGQRYIEINDIGTIKYNSIPTVFFIKNNKLLKTIVGYLRNDITQTIIQLSNQ